MFALSPVASAERPILAAVPEKPESGVETIWTALGKSSVSASVPTSTLDKVPTDVIFGCAATTGFGIVNRDVRIKKNDSSLIFGCGGVGINISQAASINKSYPIIVIDKFTKRLKFSKKHGASHFLNFKGNFRELRNKIFKIFFISS